MTSSSALMVVNITNLSVNGSIDADGNTAVVAALGDIEVTDAREKNKDKM